ncbi:MAG: hypothetical protein Q8Q63_05000 [Phaeovulum sp.]|uniref:hypothetical protein n=1 Tax=Phaeovulum sp. TaxID=2934796 RepID=UPI002733D700|nr:hypothetical protein [Phaeovulum sp.]MDP3860925.1 hypothetical protein [Phaeovulum sp.]
MLGVVVWSDAVTAGAVIWCDDHAQLAYLRGRENCQCTKSWPEVGDLVQFSLRKKSGSRFARAVRVLAEAVLPQIPKDLVNAASIPATPLRAAPHLRRVG